MIERLEQFGVLVMPAVIEGIVTIAKGGSAQEGLMAAAERLASERAKLKFPDLREG